MQDNEEMVRKKGDDVQVRLRVHPKASRNGLRKDGDGKLRVSLCAPPVDGAANKALREFVAKSLGVSKSTVSIVSGTRSREKLLRVKGANKKEIEAKLNHLAGDE